MDDDDIQRAWDLLVKAVIDAKAARGDALRRHLDAQQVLANRPEPRDLTDTEYAALPEVVEAREAGAAFEAADQAVVDTQAAMKAGVTE